MASTTSDAADGGSYANVQIQLLLKNVRNINKKLASMQKTDSVIAENPKVSLDELVAQRKINADQRASALKKPGLQAQLSALEEQITQYKKLESEAQSQLQKQEKELTTKHQQELEKIKEDAKREAVAGGDAELKRKLMIFSQFLRAAAARRNAEEDAELDENKAFEGALLLVYGGDQKAVDTAVSLIEGSDDQVLSIEGTPLPVKYSQIKQASVDHSPFQTEETWVDQVAEANAYPAEAQALATNGHDAVPVGSDPTTTHAGLTELNPPQTNGDTDAHDAPSHVQGTTGEAGGNVAGERWDTGAGAGAEKEGLDESFEMVPRPNEEVDTPAPAPTEAPQQQQSTSWADEPPAYAEPPAGNKAGESWDVKAPGQDAADDGFHEVPGRARGRGGFRGRGDGEFRGGRGGRGRGRGGPRGGRGDGEFRGRGGRGRGPRGDGPIRS